ncbi:MAG TPA: hypothetical protein VGM88_12575 [Kofleriaceae bacterium]
MLGLLVLVFNDWLATRPHPMSETCSSLSLGERRWPIVLCGAAIVLFAILTGRHRRCREWRLPRVLGIVVGVLVIAAGLCAGVDQVAFTAWSGAYKAHLFISTGAVIAMIVCLTAWAFALKDAHAEGWFLAVTCAALILVALSALGTVAFPSPHLLRQTPLASFLLRRLHVIVFLMWCGTAMFWTFVEPLQARAGKTPWEEIAAKIEVLTLPLVLLGGLGALLEYCDAHKRDRRETAQAAYQKADDSWKEFLKLCMDHPESDCYDGASLESPATSPIDEVRRRVMMSYLIDTFEVAYVSYNDPEYANDAHGTYCTEWPTWVAAIRKYARRDTYVRTWLDVGNEYDTEFQSCIDQLITEQRGQPRAHWLEHRTDFRPPVFDAPKMPDACVLYECAEAN